MELAGTERGIIGPSRILIAVARELHWLTLVNRRKLFNPNVCQTYKIVHGLDCIFRLMTTLNSNLIPNDLTA